MKRIISLFVLGALFCTAFVACNNGEENSSAVTVTVTVKTADETIIDNVKVEIEGVDGKAPVALDAVIQALDDNEIPYTTGELAGQPKLEKIGDYTTENNKYIWELYINDEEAEARISAAEIKNGDKLTVIRNDGVEGTATTEPVTTEPVTTEPVKTANDGYND